MVVLAEKRDVTIKGKKFRNAGMGMGIISRKDGTNLPICFKRSEILNYINQNGLSQIVDLNVDGEEINARIIRVQRNLIYHYPHHIEFEEIN